MEVFLTATEGATVVSETLKLELAKFRKLDIVDQDTNPTEWWKDVGQFGFPLLSKFWASYSPFQATSVAAER